MGDNKEKQLNKHRVLLVKNIEVQLFFDKMRSQGVLSLEDCQEMMARSLYPSDKQRASRFLDIIETRGQTGYDVFVECLDDVYPHLYKVITGNQPSPRPHITSPTNPLSYHSGYANLLQEVCDQKDKLQQEVNEKSVDIEKLAQERDQLNYQLGVHATKLDNYHQLLIKHKKVDTELKCYKDELLDIYVSLKNTEKEVNKYRHLSKVKDQMAHEYKEKLDKALELLNRHRHSWEKTHSKNEQLSQDKNNLQKEIQHIKMDLASTKRQSLRSLGGSFSEDTYEPSSQTLQNETLIEMLKQDKEQTQVAYEETVNELCEMRKEIDHKDMQVDKVSAENKDLKCMVEMIQMELNVTERNYKLMWQEMQRLHKECNSALDQRNQAQAELDQIRQESLSRRKLLNDELTAFKKTLSRQYPEIHSKHESNTTSTSSNGAAPKFATFPRTNPPVMHPRPSLQPRRETTTLPECDDTMSPSGVDEAFFDEADDDGLGSASARTYNWKARKEGTFTESMETQRGSRKKDKKHYEKVDFLLSHMQKSFRPRTIRLDSFPRIFTLDYEDESKEVERIMEMDVNTPLPHISSSPFNRQDDMPELIIAEGMSNKETYVMPSSPEARRNRYQGGTSEPVSKFVRQQALSPDEMSSGKWEQIVINNSTAPSVVRSRTASEDISDEPPPLPQKRSEMKDSSGADNGGRSGADNADSNVAENGASISGASSGADSDVSIGDSSSKNKRLSPNVIRNRFQARRSVSPQSLCSDI